MKSACHQFLFVFFLSVSVKANPIPRFQQYSFQETLKFYQKELDQFLPKKIQAAQFVTFKYNFNITTPNKGSFTYHIIRKQNQFTVEFSGEDAACLGHAMYSFLEHAGYRFEFNTSSKPIKLQLDTLHSYKQTIQPFTRWRGIRQHLNFPMDLSSYPLEEAKAYLRSLVRMRFNKLAVHSYPNLWNEVHTGDSIEYAGNFFYNREHPLPPLEIYKKIRFNQSLFCIPEIEPFYYNRIKRSQMAVSWLKELLTYAKQIGLTIQFSVEPRTRGDVQYIVDNCRSALQQYPMIDELEIITEELGGWGTTCTDSMVNEVLIKRFGKEILQDSLVIQTIRTKQTDLDNLLNQLGRNIEALSQMEKDPWFQSKKINYKLGVYCTIKEYANLAYHLVRKYKPDSDITIMPGHGSVRTANHFSQVSKSSSDLSKTTVFSWIEFDGLMFTQQNPIAGLESLFRDLKKENGNQQMNGILFNHWRTAENSFGSRYAALGSIFGPVSSAEFYTNYAKEKGITQPEKYGSAMIKLEDIDWISTNDLPNVGFCWLGAWLNGGPYTWMNRLTIQKVINKYDSVSTTIDPLLASTTNKLGREHLALLSNRLHASKRYLMAFGAAAAIQDIQKDSSGNYSLLQKKKASSICNNSLQLFKEYLEIHAQLMPDRGCEGTMVNLWHGPMYGVKILRQRIGQIALDAPIQSEKSTDAPPLPILLKNHSTTTSSKNSQAGYPAPGFPFPMIP